MSSCTVALSNSPAFSPSSSSSSSSSSPRLAWLHKPRGRIRAFSGGEPSPLLKRKRPARLDIPAVAVAAERVAVAVETPEVAEAEGDGYSVCCKRGRKDVMEDRFSAVLDQKQVIFLSSLFCNDS